MYAGGDWALGAGEGFGFYVPSAEFDTFDEIWN